MASFIIWFLATSITIAGAISVFGPCPYWCGVDKEK